MIPKEKRHEYDLIEVGRRLFGEQVRLDELETEAKECQESGEPGKALDEILEELDKPKEVKKRKNPFFQK